MASQLETDYLVVGAGATGASFTDTLISNSDYEVLLIDERHQPGGHWVDAYPFVQLHQPSAYYGVSSLPLGQDRIDETGINAGFYERARAAELIDYYERHLLNVLLPSGRVFFQGSTTYVGQEDGHHLIRSNITGKTQPVKIKQAIVDATITQSSIPATHQRNFEIDDDVNILTPNELVNVSGAQGYTVLGAGKTSMDVCFWLLQQGVDPNEITWVRPRDGWFVERTYTQPLSLAKNMVRYQAQTFTSVAEATSGFDFAKRMEAEGMMVRLDPKIDATVFRGATVSLGELDVLREIDHVVRKGRVKSVSNQQIHLESGDHKSNPGRVFVDCTAQGLSSAEPVTIFEGQKINMHFTTMGVAPWSAAMIAFVETLDLPLQEKNRLCPSMPRSGDIEGQLDIMKVGFSVEMPRRELGELTAWNASCRLNPGRTITDHMEDPDVIAAFASIMNNFESALENLERLTSKTS